MIFGESIVALSSGRLPSGVAVIRVSGPHSRFVIETIAGHVPPERQAVYRRLISRDGDLLDRALMIFFVGPNSFTGEDVVEFQVHGGSAVVRAVLQTITSLTGVRSAEPGEFTRRAFLNGKLDLVQTEALSDLVNAETEAQRRFAIRNTSGVQSELYERWRDRIVHARAMIEAEIDFADEEDVPESVAQSVWSDVSTLIGEIDRHISGYAAAEIIQEGLDVVILGAPNAGKSSLFNALARRDAAIVSDEPGTTRDLLEVFLDIEGIKVRVTDTAGLREGAGKVESIGIERARAKGRDAHLILNLVDLTDPHSADFLPPDVPKISVGTKLDLVESQSRQTFRYDMLISTLTGEGIAELVDELGRRAIDQATSSGDVLPSRLRHVELLGGCVEHLRVALTASHLLQELRAEELRLASDQLGRIVGAVDVEDLLDVIFSRFCIGK